MKGIDSATVYSKPPTGIDFDKRTIVQNDDNQFEEYRYYITDISSFVNKTGNLFLENKTLRQVVKNLWKTYQYNQEYISYLLGTYSKEEFTKIAKQYAEPFNESVNNTNLMFSLNLISSFLTPPLTSNDYSIMLNVECLNIDSKLKAIDHQAEIKRLE
jgi:hypothetical protein